MAGAHSKENFGRLKMDIPLNAKVHCVDGECGHSTYVIIDPVSRQVTHLVVKENGLASAEHVLPIKWVTETTHNLIRLRCTKEQFTKMAPFVEEHYLREPLPDFEHPVGGYFLLPYRVRNVMKTVQVETRHIPAGELAVHRGASVEATDGHVGRVDEFLVDPENSHITHLILSEGHLWGQKDVTIPVSEIDKVQENRVYLKLDKQSIEALPSIPLRHGWFQQN
jgi:sporulation protein YlmC with PRC-barrel domain